jgi:hypothetical protein
MEVPTKDGLARFSSSRSEMGRVGRQRGIKESQSDQLNLILHSVAVKGTFHTRM